MCKRARSFLPAFHGYSLYILIHFIFALFPRRSLNLLCISPWIQDCFYLPIKGPFHFWYVINVDFVSFCSVKAISVTLILWELLRCVWSNVREWMFRKIWKSIFSSWLKYINKIYTTYFWFCGFFFLMSCTFTNILST